MSPQMMHCIRRHVLRFFTTISVFLEKKTIAFINFVCFGIAYYSFFNERLSICPSQLYRQIILSWSHHIWVWACWLLCLDWLKWAIFNEYAVWLECIDKLLAKADTLLVVTATMNNYGLAWLLVLENGDAILEVKVNSELIIGKFNVPKLACFESNLFSFHILEQI